MNGLKERVPLAEFQGITCSKCQKEKTFCPQRYRKNQRAPSEVHQLAESSFFSAAFGVFKLM